jgi:hypothetical protein
MVGTLTTIGLHTIVCIVSRGLDYRRGFTRLWLAAAVTWYGGWLIVHAEAISSWSGFHYGLLRQEGSISAAIAKKRELRETLPACYAARDAVCLAPAAPEPSESEKAAQIAELSNRTGLPYDVVARNFAREKQRAASTLFSDPTNPYDQILREMYPFLPAYIEGCERSTPFLEALRREAGARGMTDATSISSGLVCEEIYGMDIPHVRPEILGIALAPFLPIALYFPLSWIARGFARRPPEA